MTNSKNSKTYQLEKHGARLWKGLLLLIILLVALAALAVTTHLGGLAAERLGYDEIYGMVVIHFVWPLAYLIGMRVN